MVEVKDGYGRNYLLPQGFAILATQGALKQVDSIRRARRPARFAIWTMPRKPRRHWTIWEPSP